MDALNTFVLLSFISILLVGAAQRFQIPYPIALVLGGLVLGFVPGLTPISFDPMILLAIILPPILFYASYSISFKDLIRYFNDIFFLALVLVIATTLVVGFLFKWLFPELSWALAFVFGAIVSPPDAVAATAILKRFPVTDRLEAILEGESLINDASALVIYRYAVIALLTGSFSIGAVALDALYVVFGGIFIGLICGYILNKISSHLSPVLAVVYSFVIPYVTYCIANFSGVSGVLAVVTCGLLGARILTTQFSPITRVLGWATWDIVIILLNCFIFILIGVEFRHAVEKMSFEKIWLYSAYGVLITLAIIAIRFISIYSRRIVWHLTIRHNPALVQQSKIYFRHAILSSWAGMRGIVSLTAALALPLTLPNGMPVEGREIVIFLTFEVIFLSLVLPGLTMPALIRWLKIKPSHSNKELLEARKVLAEVAKDEIHKLHELNHLDAEERDILCMYFTSRHKVMEFSSISEEHKIEATRHRVLQTQRRHLVQLWREDKVNDILMNQLERELDIEEAHLARGEIY